jgi:hypothetical protein
MPICDKVSNMHEIARITFVVLAGVGCGYGANFVIGADPEPMGMSQAMEVPQPTDVPQAMEAGGATPNHDPYHGSLMETAAAPLPGEVAVATPNHDPQHGSLTAIVTAPLPAETAGWSPEILRAEPEVAASPAPPTNLAFVAADTVLYAKANARLRAAPSTAAGIVAKLADSAPLHAIARSTDGAWWQVALADQSGPDQPGRTGYVHRDAVTKYQVVKLTPPVTTAPVAAAYPQPVSVRRNQGLLGAVDEAMNWLTDAAGRPQGATTKSLRAER